MQGRRDVETWKRVSRRVCSHSIGYVLMHRPSPCACLYQTFKYPPTFQHTTPGPIRFASGGGSPLIPVQHL